MIKRLKNHQYAQCRVIIDGENIDFISYATRVISIRFRDGQRMIECTGTYSATTRKQIGWFCREYLPTLGYYSMKAIAGKGYTAM